MRTRALLLASGLATAAGVATLSLEAYLGFRGGSAGPPPGSPDGVVGGGAGAPVTLLVLGDSTGVSVGATSVEMGYPRRIAAVLAAEASRPVQLHVLSVSGARVAGVRRDQLPQTAGLRPDVILLVVGANDVIHGTRHRDARRDLRAVIDGCRATGAQVVVAGVPAVGTTRRVEEPLRSVIRLLAHRLDTVWRAETSRAHVLRVELAAQTGPAFAADASLFSADLFHPGDHGYALWARVLDPVVVRAYHRGQGAQPTQAGSQWPT